MMEFESKLKKSPEGIAFISALAAGLVTHMFALVNVLHNFDDIASQPGGYGMGVPLGRWLLEIVGQGLERIGLNYNLPFFNGIAYLLLLSVAAGFLVSTLQLKRSSSAALVGMLFTVFPTVSATLFYRFTAPLYGVGVLLVVLSVWVLRRYRFGLALSVLCLGCAMGIYQAYAPITIGLFVLLMIQQALQGETTIRSLVRSGLYDCAALLLGVGFYLVCMKLSMLCFKMDLNDYQGVATMGQLALADIPKLAYRALDSFCDIASRDYCGISTRKLIQLTYRWLGIATVMMIGYILVVRVKKPGVILATGVLCLLFPIAVNFIVVMCPDSWIYTLMVYAFVLVACLSIVVAECLPAGKIAARVVGLMVALLIFCYGYYDNVNYSALYFSNRQVENYVNSIVTQVRMTEGFTAQKDWALIGEIDDPLLGSHWDEEADYGGNGSSPYLLINYSRNDWFENYIGYKIPLANEETVASLVQTDEVKEMPCWPSEGSIRVVDDVVVIKFQELSK